MYFFHTTFISSYKKQNSARIITLLLPKRGTILKRNEVNFFRERNRITIVINLHSFDKKDILQCYMLYGVRFYALKICDQLHSTIATHLLKTKYIV